MTVWLRNVVFVCGKYKETARSEIGMLRLMCGSITHSRKCYDNQRISGNRLFGPVERSEMIFDGEIKYEEDR